MCIEIRIYKYNSSARKSCNRSRGRHEESEVRDRISLFSSTALPLPMFLKTVRLENARYKNSAILKFRNRRRRERGSASFRKLWCHRTLAIFRNDGQRGCCAFLLPRKNSIASNASGRGDSEKKSKGQVTRAKFLSFFLSSVPL